MEMNLATRGVRMLTTGGWKFVLLSPEQLDVGGVLQHEGKLCLGCEHKEGPEGWKWPHGRVLSEEKKKRYGVESHEEKRKQLQEAFDEAKEKSMSGGA